MLSRLVLCLMFMIMAAIAHAESSAHRHREVLIAARSAYRAHHFALAESLLRVLPAPSGAGYRLDRLGWDAELLRMEARGFAPGHCDTSWLRRPAAITDALDGAPREQRARAWVARARVEERFGQSEESVRSARRALALLPSGSGRHALAECEARLALAETHVVNTADSALTQLALAESLFPKIRAEDARRLRPRFLRLKGEAVFWRASLDSAVRLLTQAHELALRDLPPGDPEVGRSLVFRGIAENQLLRHEAGISHRRESAETLARDVGLADERTCYAYTIYSWTLTSPPQRRSAIAMLEQVRDAMVRGGFSESIGTAWVELALGRAHASLGRPEQALALYQRSLATQRRWRGSSHADIGQVHYEIAGVLATAYPETALAHARAAQELYARIGQRSDTFRLGLQSTLGALLVTTGQWDEARAVLEPTLSEYVRLRGPTHWETTETAIQLARTTWHRGDVRAADSLYALATSGVYFADTSAAGFISPHVVERARFLLSNRDLEALSVLALPRAVAMSAALEASLPWLLDEEGQHVIGSLRQMSDVLLSSLRRPHEQLPGYRRDVLELAMRGRGLLLEAWVTRAAAMGLEQRADSDAGHELARLRRQLAGLVLASYRVPQGRVERARRDSLRERIQRLEVTVLGGVPAKESDLTFESIRQRIPPRAALVSYFRYSDVSMAGPQRGGMPQGSERYVAFLSSADRAEPLHIDLGPAPLVDSLISDYARAVTDRRRSGRAGALLRERLWDPLEAALRGVERVLVVTDGDLDRVPFPTLPAKEGGYLIERAALLHRLGHERDLLAQDPLREPMAVNVLMGNPDFNAMGGMLTANPGGQRSAPACASLLDAGFRPLRGSALEIRAVERLIRLAGGDSLLVRIGPAATEASLKALPARPALLHLATHGFFLDPACAGSESDLELVRENPLLFSGLALAGANNARAAVSRGEEDGLLTAEELAGLDLRGTQWLVLSGCESGLGQVRANEGLYGLPRAARAAGVRTTIMSVWPVDDEATAYWMEQLYRARFERREDTSLAVRSASRATLAMLRRLRREPDPRLWGAFIAVGDWR